MIIFTKLSKYIPSSIPWLWYWICIPTINISFPINDNDNDNDKMMKAILIVMTTLIVHHQAENVSLQHDLMF